MPEVGVSECQKREFAARSSSCEVSRCGYEVQARNFRENRHEIIFSIDFIICLQSVVEIKIELFVVCQKLIHVYAECLFFLLYK